MWGKIIIAIGAAVVGYFTVDRVVTVTTGKSIPDHLFRWRCELRETTKEWLLANPNLGIRQVGLRVLDHLDRLAVGVKKSTDKVTVELFGVDAHKKEFTIITRVISLDEASAKFPGLRTGQVL